MVEKVACITAALATSDDGGATTEADKLVDIGQEDEPKAIYRTGIYGVATAQGKLVLFEGGNTFAEVSDTNIKATIFITATGDGVTNVRIGPITDDLYVCGDGTLTAPARCGWITYETLE